jgi:transposase
MLNLGGAIKVTLSSGATDMRKGVRGLSLLVHEHLSQTSNQGSLYVFRGKQADKIKILWWDGQGFCLYYKCLERGKFTWPNSDTTGSVGVTGAQLSMLLEGIDWRNPRWSSPPKCAG